MVFQALVKRGVTLNGTIRRLVSTKVNSPKTLYVECLESRTLIRVVGNGVDDYLQGLITNDVKHLTNSSPALYAMFLNSKGRVLCDSIIYNTNEPTTLLIDCDKKACNYLQKHLMMYRVRRKIEVNLMDDNLKLWAVSHNQASPISPNEKNDIKPLKDLLNMQLNDCLVCCDPRISYLGVRIVAPKSLNLTDALKDIREVDVINEKFYKSLRYKLGIGEGTDELPPEKCFPLESNCDYLNGVSFHKGCYLGQELTARTYHTGVIRKRLMPVIFDEKIDFYEPDIPILTTAAKEKAIGKLRGIEGNLGIGLLRIEEALEASNLKISGKVSRTQKPFWWPTEANKENFMLRNT